MKRKLFSKIKTVEDLANFKFPEEKRKPKSRTKFFKELKKLCLEHDVITVGYLEYQTGQALGFQFDEGSYFLSGSRSGKKFQMVIETPFSGVKV